MFVTAYDQYARCRPSSAAAVDYVLKPVQPSGWRRRSRACAGAATARASAPAADAEVNAEATLAQLRALLGAPRPGGAGERVAAADGDPGRPGAAVHLVPVNEVIYFEAADKYVRVITAEREHLIRTSLRELLPQLDPERFWQVHRGTVVRCDAVATALRDDAGKVTLTLRGHADRLTVSRLYAHRFQTDVRAALRPAPWAQRRQRAMGRGQRGQHHRADQAQRQLMPAAAWDSLT